MHLAKRWSHQATKVLRWSACSWSTFFFLEAESLCNGYYVFDIFMFFFGDFAAVCRGLDWWFKIKSGIAEAQDYDNSWQEISEAVLMAYESMQLWARPISR